MRQLWTTLLSWADAHPLLAATILATAAASVLSSVWYAVRRAVWPGVETARLPTWARVVQALVELLVNLPGALRALAATPSAPPGAPRQSTLPPSAPAVVLAVLVLGGGLACGPRPVSGAAMLVAPGVPRPEGCAPVGATRCTGSVPEACGESGRWWPLPECPHGCELAGDAGARCARGAP